MSTSDEHFAGMLARERTAALTHLRTEMEARGLREGEGWRISETTRDGGGGTELVLRPVHSRLPAPGDLECVIRIDGDHGSVESSCEPPRTQ